MSQTKISELDAATSGEIGNNDSFVVAVESADPPETKKVLTTVLIERLGINAKAPLASPTFTGTPAAPTAANGTNTTQVATTGFVQSAITLLKDGVATAGDTLAKLYALIGTKANTTHAHDAADITTGTLDPARIPVIVTQGHIVSSGAIADLTTPQQDQIQIGWIVTTTDGRRFSYTGSGSKTSEASYIELADVTPDWGVIANKPTSFAPDIANLSTSSAPADSWYLALWNGATNAKVLVSVLHTLFLSAARTFAELVTLAKGLALPSNGAALSLGTNQVDYALPNAAVVRISPTASFNFTGFAAGSDGQIKILENVGTTFDFYLYNERTSSSAANRIVTPSSLDIAVKPGQNVILCYDGTSSRWRVIERQFQSGHNLVPNAGFDQWFSSTLPYAWVSIAGSTWPSGTNIAQETTNLDSAPYSAKVGDGATNTRGMAMENSVRVIPGERYTLALRARGESSTSDIRVVVKALQSDNATEITSGAAVGGNGWSYSAASGGWLKTFVPGTSYVDIVESLQLDSNTHFLKIAVMYGTVAGTKYIYVDRVYLGLGWVRPAWHLKPVSDSGDQTVYGNVRAIVAPYPLTDAATIAVNRANGFQQAVTLGGNRTLGAPTGAYDGEMILFAIKQDGTGNRTLTLTTSAGGYRATAASGTALTLSTAAGKVDYLLVRYVAADNYWDILDFVKAA